MKKKHIIWFSIGTAVATLATLFLLRKKEDSSEKPPKKAPQVPINNPGEQSEFTTAASESDMG